MRVLSTQELQAVAAGSDSDFADVFAEVMVEVFIDVLHQLIVEMIVQSTIAGIQAIRDYYYPPHVIQNSHFRPALTY